MADNAAEPLKVQVPLCVRCYTQHREYRGVTYSLAGVNCASCGHFTHLPVCVQVQWPETTTMIEQEAATAAEQEFAGLVGQAGGCPCDGYGPGPCPEHDRTQWIAAYIQRFEGAEPSQHDANCWQRHHGCALDRLALIRDVHRPCTEVRPGQGGCPKAEINHPNHTVTCVECCGIWPCATTRAVEGEIVIPRKGGVENALLPEDQ